MEGEVRIRSRLPVRQFEKGNRHGCTHPFARNIGCTRRCFDRFGHRACADSSTGNVGLFSQYVFRGITQTNEKPAVQGGFDLGHKSGFYVGTWASNISWISDYTPGVSASLEWDFYGGYKGSLPADFGYDLGVLYYY